MKETITRFILAIATVAAVGMALPRAAAAGPITLGYQGSVYTLYGYQTASQTSTNNYTLTLLVNAQNFNAGGSTPVAAYLDAVSFKFDTTLSAATLMDAPGGTGPWTTGVNLGLNGNGCGGSGTGYFCSGGTEAAPANATGQSTPMSFTWVVTDTSSPITEGAAGNDTLKVFYTTDGTNATKVGGLYSEAITLNAGPPSTVPEPGSLFLLGTGLLGLAFAVKKYALV